MNFLKSQFLNPPLRFIARAWTSVDKTLRRKWLFRIRYAGNAPLHVGGVDFTMFSQYDDSIVDSLYFRTEHYSEMTELKLFMALAKDSQVILDIGANTGLYSILSRKSNPQADIFAFEPYLTNAKRLRKNLALNDITNVEVIEKAVGEGIDEIEFAVPEHDRICDVLSADTEFTNKFYKKWVTYKNVKVPQTSIDEFIRTRDVTQLDLIKIDVENFEISVFKGGLETLRRFSPVILVEIFVNPDKILFFNDMLRPLGYHCYLILKEGIVRVNSLIENQNCRNFIFSKSEIQDDYVSYLNLPHLASLLRKEKI